MEENWELLIAILPQLIYHKTLLYFFKAFCYSAQLKGLYHQLITIVMSSAEARIRVSSITMS